MLSIYRSRRLATISTWRGLFVSASAQHGAPIGESAGERLVSRLGERIGYHAGSLLPV
jgi:hypothetical protein